VQAALPLAIIGYMGAVTIAKTISRQYGPYAVYASSELWGQVAANAACGLGSALPVTGSFSRSAVNCSSGARTGAASILTALSMALALLCLTQPLAYIPPVARSAIVLVAIGKMIELHLLPVFWAGERRDAVVFLVTLLVVLFADSASGLVAGLAVQWVFALLRHSGEPTRVRLQAWVRGSLGGSGAGAGAAPAALPAAGASSSSSSACDAALAQMRAQGMAWKDVTSLATLQSTSGEGAGPQFPHCAVTLQWAPDVHFSSCERLAEAVGEAVALAVGDSVTVVVPVEESVLPDAEAAALPD
jgi:MFS superfamily sulfate permease-like transporter